jgi:hypothetical protein
MSETETEQQPEEPEETPDETPDEPEEEEEEQQDEPAAQSVPQFSEIEAEKAAKDSATDWKRLSARTLDRWGAYASQLVECPLCTDDHKGFVDVNMAGRYPQDVVRGIQQFLGLSQPIEYVQSQHTKTCTHCQGEGKVKSGSHVPEFAVRKCDDCNGFGFLPPPQAARNGAVIEQSGVMVDLPPPEDFEHADVDEFNQPMLLPDGRANPNYGKRPSYWVQVEPWGNTVGLTAMDAV